jgi:Bacterial regulatory proteins, luxR family
VPELGKPLNGDISPHTTTRELLQFRVRCLGLLQNGDVRVGVFPEPEEILIGRLGLKDVASRFTTRCKLNLSEHTVRNYLIRIFDKLGISSRVELVLYAFSNTDGNSALDAANYSASA